MTKIIVKDANVVVGETDVAIFYDLVKAAKHTTKIELNEDLEAYIVFLLTEFLPKPDIVAMPLAIQLLETMQMDGSRKKLDAYKGIGDVSLIKASMFKEQMRLKGMPADYYSDIGRTAYYQMSIIKPNVQLYFDLFDRYLDIVPILEAIRCFSLTSDLYNSDTKH